MHAVRVTVICDECVRIEYAPFGPGGEPGRFCDFPSLFAIHGPAGDEPRVPEMGLQTRVYTTSSEAGSTPIRVRTRRMSLEYVPDGRPPHAGNMHATIEHPSPPAGVEKRGDKVVWTPGAANRFNLGGTLSTLDGLRGAYPLGEGLLARDGWHVVDDSRRHVLVDGWAATRESQGLGPNTDWYLFGYGEDYASALNAMTIIAGRVPMPRRCTLGSWYSRYWPYTSDEFRGIVDEFELHGFGLDVLVLDMDWHKPGWTGWSWNRELIPDPEDLIAWLHSRGLAVTLNLHPADGVGPHEDRYAAFMRAIGREADGSTVPFDAGDRRYMRALFDQVHWPLEVGGGKWKGGSEGEKADARSGVDFWWVDWQQDKFVRSIPGLTNLRWLNHLYFEHTKRGGSDAHGGAAGRSRRGVSFSRWAADDPNPDADSGTEWGHPTTGGWGDHRYPIHFSGDAHTGWKMLEFQVPFTAAAGNIGCFFWSHDIGGHFGPRLEEATTRWVQFGALSAALRLHSARTASLDRRPWTYEERYCAAMRQAFERRAALMPYVYSSVRACHEAAAPLLRPMYLGWPREERAYRSPAQYMLGPDVLVAPIVTAGMGERCVATQRVWFPPTGGAGDERHASWYDLETGERHEGGTTAIVSADIAHVPVFVRAGAIVPMRPPTRRMASDPLTRLVLRGFPGADGDRAAGELYEDDGESLDHERGRCARTPLGARWARTRSALGGPEPVVLEATVGPTTGEFDGQPSERAIELHMGGVHRVVSARCGSVDLPVSAGAGMAVIEIGTRSIREEVRVRIVLEAEDSRLVAFHARQANLVAAMDDRRAVQVGGVHLREAVIAACRADAGGGDMERRNRLLAIGAGIGAMVEDGELRVIDSLGWIDGGRAQVEFVDRLGEQETAIGNALCVLGATGDRARDGAVALPRAAAARPTVGLRVSRLARVRFTIDAAPMVVEAVVHTAMAPLTEFVAAGPFPWDWRTPIGEAVFDPERGGIDPAAAYTGRDGARVEWRPAVRGPKWDVDLRSTLNARGGVAYAATTLIAARDGEATVHLECGDKLEAFVNGVKVITLDDHGAHASVDQFVRVRLRAGPNALLIKTTDGGGGWGFTASVEADRAVLHERPRGAGFMPIVG